jgi:hypothetical protein
MSSFYDTYDYMLDIIETLENKINFLEMHLINPLQSKLKMNNNYIELLETKLKSEFIKNEELNTSVISLEKQLKEQMDELFSLTYTQRQVSVADTKITNEIIQLFEDKLEIEFSKNDDLRRQIVVLENKLYQKSDWNDEKEETTIENLRSYSKTVIKAFNIALGI